MKKGGDGMSDYLNVLKTAMDISASNRKIIANNISNYNNPDFKATEVNFESFFQQDSSLQGINDNPKHIAINANNDAVNTETSTKERFDGNNVDLTEEMVNMIKNNYRFNNAVSAYNKEMSMIRSSLGR